MNRIALVSRLKPGAQEQASGLLEQGPPLNRQNVASLGTRVPVGGEVVFVFEGDEIEWIVTEIVNEPVGAVVEALGTWRELVEDPSRSAARLPGKAMRTGQSAVSGGDGQHDL